MANLHDCIERATGAGELDGTRAGLVLKEYDQLVAQNMTFMSRAEAEVSAALALREATTASAVERRHKVIAQFQAAVRMRELVGNSSDPAVAVRNLLVYSDGSGFTGESVASVRDALISSINFEVQDTLRAVGVNLIGNNRKPATLRNILRELHGDATGDVAAKALAQSVRRQQERLRLMFNAHGGNIGKLDDFGVSHSHNGAKMIREGLNAWMDFVAPQNGPHLLDWSRITDNRTGKPFGTADGPAPRRADIEPFLTDVFEGITKRGWDTRDPSFSMSGRALYNRRAEHRVLHFKSGDDWLTYNKRFGQSDPFSAMIGGLHGMARDIALMRVLGPNPRMGLEFAVQVAEKRLAGNAKAVDRLGRRADIAKAMLGYLDGSANVASWTGFASFMSGVRAYNVSTQLGSAFLSSVTDNATMSLAARVVGMSPKNLLHTRNKLLVNSEFREMAARSGYVAGSLADMGAVSARWTGEVFTPDLAQRAARVTLRASLLSQLTDMNRVAFQLEFAGFLATQANRTLDQVQPELRKILTERGITPADWDALRAPGTLHEPEPGVTFLSPMLWKERTDLPRAEAEGLAARLQMIIEEQMEFAVPTASIEAQAVMMMGTRPGTVIGELAKSSFMYKSFAMSVTLGQIRRFHSLPTGMNRWAYAAAAVASLTVLGAVAMQAKEVAKGRDPRPMDDLAFWGAALLQGGGVGIFGDFFTAQTNRFGGGFAQTLAGPVVSFADDIARPIVKGVMAPFTGESYSPGKELMDFVRYNTPVASSLWYGRLAFDRMVADQLQQMLDPEAESRWRRQERNRQRDYGTSTFWNRGALWPSRAPDLSNAMGDR